MRIPRSKRRFGSVLAKPSVLLATVVGFLLVGACAATEVGVIAFFGDEGAEAGIVLAIWAVSSLVGGLSLGHVPIGPWALARRMFVVFLGSALAILAWEFWSLSFALVIAGLCIAPALAVMFSIVSATVKFSDTAEAYGWVGTGQLIGAALGSAVGGLPDRRDRRCDRGVLGRDRVRRGRSAGRDGLPSGEPRPPRSRRQPAPRHRTRTDPAPLTTKRAMNAATGIHRPLVCRSETPVDSER